MTGMVGRGADAAGLVAKGNWGLHLANFLHAQSVRVSVVAASRMPSPWCRRIGPEQDRPASYLGWPETPNNAALFARFCRMQTPASRRPPATPRLLVVGASRHPPTKGVPPRSSRPATRLTGNTVSPRERAEAMHSAGIWRRILGGLRALSAVLTALRGIGLRAHNRTWWAWEQAALKWPDERPSGFRRAMAVGRAAPPRAWAAAKRWPSAC
jgi:hypothetical protein